MNINRITLKFSADIETQFKEYYYENSKIASRIAFILVAVLYSMFGLLDYLIAPEYTTLFWKIRFLVVVPILITVFLLSFTRSFKRYWQSFLFLAFIVAGTGINIMIVILHDDFAYSNGLLLIFFAGYVFIKLRFILASIAGWITLISYNIIAVYYGNVDIMNLVSNDFFFFSAIVIGMFASYNTEVYDRRNFYLLQQVASKNEAIEQINKSLENKVEKRTELLNFRNTELHEEIARRIVIEQELILSKERAEQSDKLKSAFLANMSHEIRTPMNGIIGFANLLREAENEEELHEFIEIIIKNGDHLLSLINDIIDLSKIEAGILKVQKQIFSVNTLTKEIYDLFLMDHNVVERNLELIVNNPLGDEESTIKTDRTRLKQILINLVNNAVKYTDKGSIEFSYSIIGNKIHFEVKDTGIGISQEQQENLFERFMQVTLNNTPTREGTGLGLAITKTYLKLMGGDIQVRSTPQVGSIFSFYLPIEFVKDNE